jgi:hypothetical protein
MVPSRLARDGTEPSGFTLACQAGRSDFDTRVAPSAWGTPYVQYADVGAMPVGGRIAKDSFTVSPDGRVAVGPLFIMEKMADGFDEASDDWRYAMIMPDGSLFGVTNGPGSEKVQFCAECHAIVADDQDSLYFLPEEFCATFG